MYKKLPDDFSLICDLRSSSSLDTSAEQLRWIKSSVEAKHYFVFKNNLGFPVGYALWAKVNKETLARLARTGVYPQFYYEWNEGHITLLLDVFLSDALTLINRKQLLWLRRHHKILTYLRKGKLVLKFSRQTRVQKLASNNVFDTNNGLAQAYA